MDKPKEEEENINFDLTIIKEILGGDIKSDDRMGKIKHSLSKLISN